MAQTSTHAGIVTCTLTIKDDHNGEYDDDLQYQRSEGKARSGSLGRSQITRLVVELLDRWVDNYYKNCRRDELAVLGKALYAIAFGDDREFPLRTAFESTLRQCRNRGMRLRLRLVLEPDVKELAKYPWEFMYLELSEQDEGFFLAGQDTSLSLTRFVPNSSVWSERSEFAADRLRILVVVSTPTIPGMTELNVGDFVERLEALDPKRFDIRTTSSPTQMELQSRIRDHEPHVIHFIGHGRPGELALRKDEATLQRERDLYETRRELGQRPQQVSDVVWINQKTASDVLRTGLDEHGAPSRLIFLHACEGARADQTRAVLEGFGSVARELARSDRISGVIAMQYTIGVEDAELFATAFYENIANGEPLDDAMTKARKKLAETPRLDHLQSWDDRGFGTPVIYLRSERALVSPPVPSRSPEAATEKEPCPNPRCDGYVLRTQHHCKACREPFTVCPNPKCPDLPVGSPRPPGPIVPGLIVAKPGWECRDCPYTFGDPMQDAQQPGPVEPRAPRPSRGLEAGSSALEPLGNQEGGPDERLDSDFDRRRNHPGTPLKPRSAEHSDTRVTSESSVPPQDDERLVRWA